ncbi:MAG TPA: hypothetical protein VML75_26695, partial [Kofleriaceae bacterium]|nr:hypothetical protein [Kofleriaceae bacterium]
MFNGVVLGLVAVALVVGAPEPAAAEPAAKPATIRVCVQPFGDYDAHLMTIAMRGIEHVYGFEVAALSKRALPMAAYYKPRKRYRADTLLDHIRTRVWPK